MQASYSGPISNDVLTTPEGIAFMDTLKKDGLHASLGYLNSRTPHRFTGIYRYDQNMVRNVVLFDRSDPSLSKGTDVPRTAAYCAIVGQTMEPLEILDTEGDANCFGVRTSPVISYCGVLITDQDGEPFGTLCHYDMARCEHRSNEIPLLQAAATAVYQWLVEHGRIKAMTRL